MFCQFGCLYKHSNLGPNVAALCNARITAAYAAEDVFWAVDSLVLKALQLGIAMYVMITLHRGRP